MKFKCPACTQHLDGEFAYADRTINCPACGHEFVVPRPGAAPAAPAGVVETRPAPPTPQAAAPTPRPALPALATGQFSKTSKLAIAGRVIGFLFLVLIVAGGVILWTNRGSLKRQVPQSVRPVGTNDYSLIDVENPAIPSQPAAGPVNGSMFYVRRAKIVDSDLVLIGDTSSDVPEIRLHPETGAHIRFQFNILPLLQNAARYKVATQLQPNGVLAKSCTVTLRTAGGSTDLTSDAGIRLVFHAPNNGRCKTAIHLAFGPTRKEYVLGEFMTDLSPDLMRKVQGR